MSFTLIFMLLHALLPLPFTHQNEDATPGYQLFTGPGLAQPLLAVLNGWLLPPYQCFMVQSSNKGAGLSGTQVTASAK